MHTLKLTMLTILIVPGLTFLYAIVLRPLLHKIPRFKLFNDEADGFWAKVWALCGNSMTILWGYLVAGFGSSLEILDWASQLFGDPDLNLKQKITDALINYPSIAAYVSMAVAAITIASRLRSIIWKT